MVEFIGRFIDEPQTIYRLFIHKRRKVVGYEIHAKNELIYANSNIVNLSKEKIKQLKNPQTKVGKTFTLINSNAVYWLYTHTGGRVSIMNIPHQATQKANELQEACHVPCTPIELMFLLQMVAEV